jgi:hypothetical protein
MTAKRISLKDTHLEADKITAVCNAINRLQEMKKASQQVRS